MAIAASILFGPIWYPMGHPSMLHGIYGPGPVGPDGWGHGRWGRDGSLAAPGCPGYWAPGMGLGPWDGSGDGVPYWVSVVLGIIGMGPRALSGGSWATHGCLVSHGHPLFPMAAALGPHIPP